MPRVPTASGGAPTPLDTGHRPVPPTQASLAGKTQAFRQAHQGSASNAHRMDFSSGDKPPVRLCNKVPSRQQGTTGLLDNTRALHKDRLCSRATTGDLRQPLVDLVPRSKEGHRQDAGMHRSPQTQRAHLVRALQDGGLAHDPALIRRSDHITKVDLNDFYMHFLIGQADRRYMRFMWEGRKFQCIGMPFGLAPAPRLATKMMALVIRFSDLAAFGWRFISTTSSYSPDPTKRASSRHNRWWIPCTISASESIPTSVQ